MKNWKWNERKVEYGVGSGGGEVLSGLSGVREKQVDVKKSCG